jgi:hypothetical protein
VKRFLCALALVALLSAAFLPSDSEARGFSRGNNRDVARLDRLYPPPCIFPPIENPCAVPCRPVGLQPQAVPCAFKTACPSNRLPCHGVAYGNNPYPIFQ